MIRYIYDYLNKNNIIRLGRWGLNVNKKQIDKRVDLANEDHCGKCGEYLLEKQVKNKKLFQIENKILDKI
jgi:hypothetical protein